MLWKTRPGSADSRTVTLVEFRVEFKVQYGVRFNGLNLSVRKCSFFILCYVHPG